MKKYGFTLAEVLVSLGVLAVVAAMVAPAVEVIRPDANKIKVLKVYREVSNINKDLLSDKSYYMPGEVNGVSGARVNGNCEGLTCDALPYALRYKLLPVAIGGSEPEPVENAVGNDKYPVLLKMKMEPSLLESTTVNNGTVEFTTTDGCRWRLVTLLAMDPVSKEKIDLEIIPNDSDISFSAACTYSSTCKNPEKFHFRIDVLGRVIPVDPLSKAYLENPYKMNSKKQDKKRADALS